MPSRRVRVGAEGRGPDGRRARTTVSLRFPACRCRLSLRRCGVGARRRRGVVGGRRPCSVAPTASEMGTGSRPGCSSLMGDPLVTMCSMIAMTAPTGIRSCSRRHVLRSCPIPIHPIVANLRSHVRPLHPHPGDRNGSDRRSGLSDSPGLRPLVRLYSGGSGAPTRRDGSAVATARASGRV
ncbi:MAG TPA: hypothetical protein VK773_07555 [Acidimicrobiales bacterium]|nr:hypothetical protein [Acidimicrobiales bacterium]